MTAKAVWLGKPQDLTTEFDIEIKGSVQYIDYSAPFSGYSIVFRDAPSESLADTSLNSNPDGFSPHDQIFIEFDNSKDPALDDPQKPHVSVLHRLFNHSQELFTQELGFTLDRDFAIRITYKKGLLDVYYNGRSIVSLTIELSDYISTQSLIGFCAYTNPLYKIIVRSLAYKNSVEPYYAKWGAYPLEIGMELSSHAFSATGFSYDMRLPHTIAKLHSSDASDVVLELVESPEGIQATFDVNTFSASLTWDPMPGYDAFIIIRDGEERGYAYSNSYTDTDVYFGLYIYRVVAVKAGGFLSPGSEPYSLLTRPFVIFEHGFSTSSPLIDSSIEGNDYESQIYVEDASYLFEHQFSTADPLGDTNEEAGYDYDSMSDNMLDKNPALFEHDFSDGLSDNLNTNDYEELNTTPDLGGAS